VTPSTGPSTLLIALIALGGLVLLTLVAILFLLIGQSTVVASQGGTPEPTGAPEPTISPTPEVTAPIEPVGDGPETEPSGGQQPEDTSMRFTAFTVDHTVECDPTGMSGRRTPSISWATANTGSVWWKVGRGDAAYVGLPIPLSGDQDDLSASKGPDAEPFQFPCTREEEMDVTFTLLAEDGERVSTTITFVDVNWP
jgi:hypothetical protein